MVKKLELEQAEESVIVMREIDLSRGWGIQAHLLQMLETQKQTWSLLFARTL
jgi:hypothetical protein